MTCLLGAYNELPSCENRFLWSVLRFLDTASGTILYYYYYIIILLFATCPQALGPDCPVRQKKNSNAYITICTESIL